MKRYPPFDPPEYVAFAPDRTVMAEYRATLERHADRRALLARLRPPDLLRLYEGMVRFRLHDITLKRWVRQGILSKAWLGTGEEATTIGSTRALREGDVVGPMIRNAGAGHEMGMPVAQMLKAYLGTADQITRGRDLHTGDPERGVIPPTSMMANLVPVFTGIGLAFRRRREARVALTWVGDGATRTAAFHEGINFAAVTRVPVVFVVQNNRVALGTPVERHTRGPLPALARAYGVHGLACDGNNVLDVHAAAALQIERCRAGRGPAFLFAETFRMGGHATHDEAEARDLFGAEKFAEWGRRDPIGTFETYLIQDAPALDGRRRSGTARKEANRAALEAAEARVTAEVEAAAEEALASRRDRMPEGSDAVLGVYAAGGTDVARISVARGRRGGRAAARRSPPPRRPKGRGEVTRSAERRRRVS